MRVRARRLLAAAVIALSLHVIAVAASAVLGFEEFLRAERGSYVSRPGRFEIMLDFVAHQPMRAILNNLEREEEIADLAMLSNAAAWALGGSILASILFPAIGGLWGALVRPRVPR